MSPTPERPEGLGPEIKLETNPLDGNTCRRFLGFMDEFLAFASSFDVRTLYQVSPELTKTINTGVIIVKHLLQSFRVKTSQDLAATTELVGLIISANQVITAYKKIGMHENAEVMAGVMAYVNENPDFIDLLENLEDPLETLFREVRVLTQASLQTGSDGK